MDVRSYCEFIHEGVNYAADNGDEVESVPWVLEITLQGKIVIGQETDNEDKDVIARQ